MLNVDILFSLLEKRNIKQSDLSKATGISTGNISDWKKGKSFPSAEKLVLIADFLGCSTDYLLGRIDEPGGIYQNLNSGNIVNGNNGDNSPLTVNSKASTDDDTDELVDLVKQLPLVKRAEAVIYLNDLKNKE